ncbi:DNA polymerase III subunit beta [Porphyromonas sp.]|uniref:DNA polymerase III subunit beta n=1 Tax=Porphyromonas sp. TaxID=1924944 RepID=UPI0026DBE4EB|nr:DNA polymerase III subunit beta [Porphyromonas sp.]MDO4771299.1 DNA polymerase III subunit beta [Porphyromonas sp.]
MKFRISSDSLYAHLLQISKVIVQKNSVPILDSVLFELKGEQLVLTASDGETRLVTRLELDDTDGGQMSIAIKNKMLLEPLKEISGQTISMTVDEETMLVTVKYQNGTFSFKAQSGETYPAVAELKEEPVTISIPQNIFLAGIGYTINATSPEDARPITTGIHFDVKPDHITFVGTDGFLLSMYKNNNVKLGLDTTFTFQKKPALLLRAFLHKEETAPLDLKIYGTHAVIKTENVDMVCRLIEGKYPNYLAVIPKFNQNEIIADRVQFLSALRRVSMFTNQAFNLISFDISADRLHLKGNDTDFSTAAEEQVPISYTGNPQLVSFRSTQLMEILNYLNSEKISFKLGDKATPGLLSPFEVEDGEEITSLVMPLMS